MYVGAALSAMAYMYVCACADACSHAACKSPSCWVDLENFLSHTSREHASRGYREVREHAIPPDRYKASGARATRTRGACADDRKCSGQVPRGMLRDLEVAADTDLSQACASSR